MFITRFIVSNIAVALVILPIFAIKRIFASKISVKSSYILWFFPVLFMLISLAPNIDINIFPLSGNAAAAYITNKTSENISYLAQKNFYTDKIQNNADKLLLFFYTAGLIIYIIYFIYGNLAAYKTITKENLKHKKAEEIFALLKIKYNVNCRLVISSRYGYPFSWGIIKPVVFIPYSCLNKINEEELEFIITHEIIHIKRKDLIFNFIISALECIYWINPSVHAAFKEIRLDMELCCDNTILNCLNNEKRNIYAYTILKFIQSSNKTLLPVKGIAGNKKQIFKRINKIAEFNKIKKSRILSVVIIFIIGIFSVFPFLCMTGFSYDPSKNYNKNIENKISIDLDSFFKGFDGCFVLYNTADDTYYFYNEKKARRRFAPNSTYKISVALNALENDIISDDDSFMKCADFNYPFDEWNGDKDLNTAMKYSVNWYFQALDKSLGRNKIKSFLNKSNYGNRAVALDLEQYWLEDTLKISPLEQVNFLKAVFNNDLNCKPENITALKNSLKLSDKLYGKTGTGNIGGKNLNGWFMGFTEDDNNTRFFALYIESDESADGLTAMKISNKILSCLN